MVLTQETTSDDERDTVSSEYSTEPVRPEITFAMDSITKGDLHGQFDAQFPMSSQQIITEGRSSDCRSEVLEVFADPLNRAILRRISDRPMTAAELTETTGTPHSTMYRKLDQLIDTPLVEATYRLKRDGKHPRQYRCLFDAVQIQWVDRNEQMLSIDM